MFRKLVLGCLSVGLMATLAWAQVSPIVQPLEAAYTASQSAALQERIIDLETVLGRTSLGSRKTMSEGGWTALNFATFTAGSLELLGYQVAVATQTDVAGVQRAWVLVLADLGDGSVAWIPVEAYPPGISSQKTLGTVPRIEFTQYDVAYTSFDEVLALSTNTPPLAIITPPVSFIVENIESAWFGHQSVDPDGEIVSYQWAFNGEVQRATSTKSIWYSFPSGGREYPVELTVTDKRGAQVTATYNVYVLTQAEWEEANDCGCDKT